MFTVWLKNAGDTLNRLVRMKNMLGKDRKMRLMISKRSRDIIEKQAGMGRNVGTLTKRQQHELAQVAKKHIEKARDASGKIKGGQTEARKMYKEVGELYRDIVGDKIDDTRKVRKRKLTAGYAKRKMRKWGRTHPILVASGEMLQDVRRAKVRVSTGR